ncbi:MAG: hypothetical protein AB7L76_17290 [Burkholderiaceae bacterium]
MESKSACGRRRARLLRVFGAGDAAGVELVLRERRAAALAALLRRAFAFLLPNTRARRGARQADRAAPGFGREA